MPLPPQHSRKRWILSAPALQWPLPLRSPRRKWELRPWAALYISQLWNACGHLHGYRDRYVRQYNTHPLLLLWCDCSREGVEWTWVHYLPKTVEYRSIWRNARPSEPMRNIISTNRQVAGLSPALGSNIPGAPPEFYCLSIQIFPSGRALWTSINKNLGTFAGPAF